VSAKGSDCNSAAYSFRCRGLQLSQKRCKPRGGFFRLMFQMSIFSKLFSRKAQPTQRIRICVECGMPVAEHKDWCSILRTQQEMAKKSAVPQAPVPSRS
jgi:hypothetical protein